MDQIQIIFVNETYQNDQVQVRFLVNSEEVLPNLEYTLQENNPECYSQTIYEHLLKQPHQVWNYLVFIEPLNCIQAQRWRMISQLAADLILKLLNLKYISIIRTNYSLYKQEPITLVEHSVICKLNMNIQKMCQNKSIVQMEMMNLLDDFKQLYRIQLLHCPTFEPVKRQKYDTFEFLFTPIDQLILKKTSNKYSVSLCLQQLKGAEI